MMYLAIIILPLLGSIVFGSFGRKVGVTIRSCTKNFFKTLTVKQIAINLLIRTIVTVLVFGLVYMNYGWYDILVLRITFSVILGSGFVYWKYDKIVSFYINTSPEIKMNLFITYVISIIFYIVIYNLPVFVGLKLAIIFFPEYYFMLFVKRSDSVICHINPTQTTLKLRNPLVWDPNKLYTPDDNVPNTTMPYWNEGYNPNSLEALKALFNNQAKATEFFYMWFIKKRCYNLDQFHSMPLQLFKQREGVVYATTIPANPWPAKLLSGSGQEELFVQVPDHIRKAQAARFQVYKPSSLSQKGWPLFVRVPNKDTGMWWMCSIDRVVPSKYELEISLNGVNASSANDATYLPNQWFESAHKLGIIAVNKHLQLRGLSLIKMEPQDPGVIIAPARPASPQADQTILANRTLSSKILEMVQEANRTGSQGTGLLQGVQEGNTRTPQSPGLSEMVDNIRRSQEVEQTTETGSSSRETTSKRPRSPELDQATTTEQPLAKRTRRLTLDYILNP